MNDQTLKQALLNLLPNAPEAIVDTIFVPEFLNALGFGLMERIPQYNTGKFPVDYALRHNTNGDIFLTTQSNPHLLLELKGRDINLSEGSAQYRSTLKQLKGYLLDSNCKTAQWGIITNSIHIQLFRSTAKSSYSYLEDKMNRVNLNDVIQFLKQRIQKLVNHFRLMLFQLMKS
jgi:hypothetical protein